MCNPWQRHSRGVDRAASDSCNAQPVHCDKFSGHHTQSDTPYSEGGSMTVYVSKLVLFGYLSDLAGDRVGQLADEAGHKADSPQVDIPRHECARRADGARKPRAPHAALCSPWSRAVKAMQLDAWQVCHVTACIRMRAQGAEHKAGCEMSHTVAQLAVKTQHRRKAGLHQKFSGRCNTKVICTECISRLLLADKATVGTAKDLAIAVAHRGGAPGYFAHKKLHGRCNTAYCHRHTH